MIEISNSPIDNNTLKPYLKCLDYTVSNQEFSILKDEESELLITSPRPKSEDLGSYYESESYISHTDSKHTLLDKIYQIVKKYSITKKVRLVQSFMTANASEKSVLDIGCGTGDFLEACQKKGFRISGIEPNEKAKSIAENKLNQKMNSDIFKLSPQQFDCISMWHVLEHVPNLTDYILELKKKLKPKGVLIIAVPNHKSYDAKYYGKFWAAFDVPRHLWHFSKKSIQLLFEKNELKVIKMIPMKFDSFYVSILSEKHKTKKGNLIKAFYIGLKSNIKAMRTKEYSSIIYIIKNS
jgi:2-polyprenyl-3-methyl-5-hydroxy-6-metoxy-1,4-benzoquinol methylase